MISSSESGSTEASRERDVVDEDVEAVNDSIADVDSTGERAKKRRERDADGAKDAFSEN